jgi:hypothetical protein
MNFSKSIFLLVIPAAFLILYWVVKAIVNSKESRFSKVKVEKLYEICSDIPIIRSNIWRIKAKLSINKIYSEDVLKFNALIIWFISSVLWIIVSIILVKTYAYDLYSSIIIVVFALVLIDIFENVFIGEETKLLEELLEFIESVKHHFDLKHHVDNSISQAIEESGPIMMVHGNKILEALKSRDKRVLEEYFKVCPNNNLKMFCNTSFFIREYGDLDINGNSMYGSKLYELRDAVNRELKKRNNTNYWLKGLSTMTIIPLFAPGPMEKYVKMVFPMTSFFYEGSLGLIIKISVILACFLCYQTIKMLKKNRSQEIVKDDNGYNLERTLLKNNTISNLVNYLKPDKNTEKYVKLVKLVSESGGTTTIEWLYVRKILSSITALLVTITLFIVSHNIDTKSILNSYTFKSDFFKQTNVGKIPDEEQLKIENSLEKDKKILDDLTSYENLEIDDVDKVISKSDILSDLDDKEREAIIRRITQKYMALGQEHLKVYEILICLYLGLKGSRIPNWILSYRRMLNQPKIKEEIFEFNTVILILMNNRRANIEMILTWLESFSIFYKNAIRRCINGLEKGEVESLISFRNEVGDNIALRRIIDRLIKSKEVGIYNAFSALESDKTFYKEEQKEENERLVEEQKTIGIIVGLFPATYVIIMNAVVPVAWATMSQLDQLTKIMG